MKQNKMRNVAVGTVKKSTATMSRTWLSRNVRHVWDRGLRWRILYLSTVAFDTSKPRSRSSERILGVPQVGFSRDMRRINRRISASVRGLPTLPFRDFHRQYSLKPCLCQRITVSGCTMTRTERQFGQIRDSQAQKIRPRLRKRGRFDCCRKAASCWRSARLSAASSMRLRKMPRKKGHRRHGAGHGPRRPRP